MKRRPVLAALVCLGLAAALLACEPAPIEAEARATFPVVERTVRLAGTPSTAKRFDAEVADDWLPRASPEEVGLDGAALDTLVREAEASESATLVVVRDGRVVVERTFGHPVGPIETRSATKSIAALAVLALVADGKIASLEVPLSTYFPEFAEGEKSAITLRHVLEHRSGLAHGRDADGINAAADRVAYARARRVVSKPGARFSYSNEATQLLAGIIEQASGLPADRYARERILEPLGITEVEWARDRSGRPQTYYGARLLSRDLARVGLMLLAEGRAGERELLPRDLVREATQPGAVSRTFGLLFWLIPRERERLEREIDHSIGYYAVGGLGQRLVVLPEARIVAVRQHRRRGKGDVYEKKVTFKAFHDRVAALDPTLIR